MTYFTLAYTKPQPNNSEVTFVNNQCCMVHKHKRPKGSDLNIQ